MNINNNPNRITPVKASQETFNNTKKGDNPSDLNFEELLKKAMLTSTDNIGMDPDTMKTIKNTVSDILPKEEEKKETNYNPNDQVSAILAAQSSIVRTMPKDPYKNKK